MRDAPDASVDALPTPRIDESRVPFATTGITPAGPLDEVRFIGITYGSGFCNGYWLSLYRTNEAAENAIVYFIIETTALLEQTEPTTGTLGAIARTSSPFQMTEDVSFEVVHLDLPPANPLRLAGRMHASTGAWMIDFTIDAHAELFACF